MSQRSEHTDFRVDSGQAYKIEQAYRSADDVFRILDLGCGSAKYHQDMKETLEGMGEKDVEIVGVDYDIDHLLNGESGRKVYADVTQETGEFFLPLEDNTFDLVYSNHLMCQLEKSENYEEIRERVDEAAERILTDSGVEMHDHL